MRKEKQIEICRGWNEVVKRDVSMIEMIIN